MSSITALKNQIAKYEQEKSIHTDQVSKLHRQAMDDLSDGDNVGAMRDEREVSKEKTKIEAIDKEIEKLNGQIAQLQSQVTNLEADMTNRRNQYEADRVNLEQQFKVEMQQLESQHAKLLG